MGRSVRGSRSLPLLLILPLLSCDLSPTAAIPPEAARIEVTAIEAPFIVDSTALTFTTEPSRYPIHTYFIACHREPGQPPSGCADTDPRESFGDDIVQRVLDAANRWGEVLDPTPRLAQTFAGRPAGGITPWRRCDDPLWSRSGVGHPYNLACSRWEKGDTMATGLHLFIEIVVSSNASFATALPDSEGGIANWGHISIGVHEGFFTMPDLRDAFLEGTYRDTLHEIGHVLGVGVGDTWWHFHENIDSISSVMRDPRAIAAFDGLGGHRWTGPKVLTIGRAGIHWEWCLASQDIMAGGVWYVPTDTVPDPNNGIYFRPDGQKALPMQQFITELTASSLRPGYVYDRAALRPATVGLPLTDWDRERCMDMLRDKGTI